jgi:hypothetical protein
MKLIHEIERRIEERLRKFFAGNAAPADAAAVPSGPELIEIQKQVLDSVLDKVQSLPRARRVFPFNDVVVRVAAADPDRRALLEAVFISEDALAHEIREQLKRDEIEFPSDLQIAVQLLETDQIPSPGVLCRRIERTTDELDMALKHTRTRWILPDGSVLVSHSPRLQLGRTAEVHDDRGRLVRRNDVVVATGDTVSRAHAHVEFDPAVRSYRIFDDGSTYGTGVLHRGRLIDLARAGARGFALSPGDEIYLGRERVRFEVE